MNWQFITCLMCIRFLLMMQSYLYSVTWVFFIYRKDPAVSICDGSHAEDHLPALYMYILSTEVIHNLC